MFHHSVDDDLEASVFVKWYLLSFLAGSVNTGAFLGAGRFVTHVTGFGSLFGAHMARGNPDQAFGILLVPVFFLLGTCTSAWLIDHRYHRGRTPHYDWVMLLVFTCLMLVVVLGHSGMFGEFGGAMRLKEDFIFLALLCLASGLQNAAITTSSGASVRTTHLTGITTDLGIGIVRTWAMKKKASARVVEVRANWVRVGTIASFYGGSVVGGVLFLRYQYLGFLLPAVIALYAFTQARIEHPKVEPHRT